MCDGGSMTGEGFAFFAWRTSIGNPRGWERGYCRFMWDGMQHNRLIEDMLECLSRHPQRAFIRNYDPVFAVKP
jgi:hypothetical protein